MFPQITSSINEFFKPDPLIKKFDKKYVWLKYIRWLSYISILAILLSLVSNLYQGVFWGGISVSFIYAFLGLYFGIIKKEIWYKTKSGLKYHLKTGWKAVWIGVLRIITAIIIFFIFINIYTRLWL